MTYRTALVTALVTSSALLGASYFLKRPPRPPALGSAVVPIITPVIDLAVAEDVLEAMDRIPGDDVTLVLHTSGGDVSSCVMIANALREFPRSTAIVPYIATSGGTLIALNARRLQMGRSAALSAVDPIVQGQRVKHLPEEPRDPAQAFAHEYQTAITRYLRDTLAARLPGIDEQKLWDTVEVFLGEHAPHEWPITRDEVAALGLPVSPAARMWGEMVDAHRRRFW
jgi:membrane-bound ClpP family serine protease